MQPITNHLFPDGLAGCRPSPAGAALLVDTAHHVQDPGLARVLGGIAWISAAGQGGQSGGKIGKQYAVGVDAVRRGLVRATLDAVNKQSADAERHDDTPPDFDDVCESDETKQGTT